MWLRTHFVEIEKTLLYSSDARSRAEKSTPLMAKDGAEPHLVLQSTSSAVLKAQLWLEAGEELTLS